MRLNDYVGQERVKKLLRPEITAARRKGIMRHLLLEGGYGTGKTALSQVVASELQYQSIVLPNARGLTAKKVREMLYDLPRTGYDVGGVPRANAEKYLIIIDEAHTMPEAEAWYEPMGDYQVTINGAVSWVPFFTLVLCTNMPQLLANPLVSRLLRYRLEKYTADELAQIVRVNIPGVAKPLADAAASRCRGIPRLAVEYARSAENYGGIEYFDVAGIDERGLTELDREYMAALQSYANPVGLATVAARLQCDTETLRGVVEPWLVQLGLIEITEKGRKLSSPGRGARVDPLAQLLGQSGKKRKTR